MFNGAQSSSPEPLTLYNNLLVRFCIQAWKLYEEKRVLDLIDPKVKEGIDEEQAHLLIQVGLLCSQGDPTSRPNMMRVVSLLSGDSPVPDVPVRPTFLGIADPNKLPPRPDRITTW